MAQRGAWTPQKVRERIKVSMLMKRLTDHVRDPEKTKLSRTQLKAIEILLKKALPDLASIDTTVHGDANAPIALVLQGSDTHG
jgi:hypothetical protein